MRQSCATWHCCLLLSLCGRSGENGRNGHRPVLIVRYLHALQVNTFCSKIVVVSTDDSIPKSARTRRIFRSATRILRAASRITFASDEVNALGHSHLGVRIGLHYGPVFSGIIDGGDFPKYKLFGARPTLACCLSEARTGRTHLSTAVTASSKPLICAPLTL